MPSRSSGRAASGQGSAAGKSLVAMFSRELADLVSSVMPAVVALTGDAGPYTCSGSGFIIDAAGHVVTNAHVVEDVRPPIDALLHGGRKQPAALIGVDALTDLALLRLEHPPRGHHLTLRDAPARLGEMCLALGNPCGRYPESVSLGIVSGVARLVYQEVGRPIYASLQTDCAISPGNSGGPLVDAEGYVIGVSVRKDQQADNVGFAIPAETVRDIIPQLMAKGEVKRASLGVSVKKGIVKIGGRDVHGVEVVNVLPGRSRTFQRGDLIVGIGDEAVTDVTDIMRLLTADRIGQSLPIEVVRRGERRTLVIRPRELHAPSHT